ncbi:unnamed protein product [Calypogeia fissa]
MEPLCPTLSGAAGEQSGAEQAAVVEQDLAARKEGGKLDIFDAISELLRHIASPDAGSLRIVCTSLRRWRLALRYGCDRRIDDVGDR